MPIATLRMEILDSGGRSDMTGAYVYEAVSPPMTAMFMNSMMIIIDIGF